MKRNRASAASGKICEKMIGRLYKANTLLNLCTKFTLFMLKLNIKVLIDPPQKIDRGALTLSPSVDRPSDRPVLYHMEN